MEFCLFLFPHVLCPSLSLVGSAFARGVLVLATALASVMGDVCMGCSASCSGEGGKRRAYSVNPDLSYDSCVGGGRERKEGRTY